MFLIIDNDHVRCELNYSQLGRVDCTCFWVGDSVEQHWFKQQLCAAVLAEGDERAQIHREMITRLRSYPDLDDDEACREAMNDLLHYAYGNTRTTTCGLQADQVHTVMGPGAVPEISCQNCRRGLGLMPMSKHPLNEPFPLQVLIEMEKSVRAAFDTDRYSQSAQALVKAVPGLIEELAELRQLVGVATHFFIGPGGEGVSVELRSGPGKPKSWAVCLDGDCLGHDGTWHWEASPSNRSHEWLKLYRYPDLDKALAIARDYVNTN